MKNLEMYGVQEMDIKEMKKTDGGGLFAGLLLLTVVMGWLWKAGEAIFEK